jgi:hypothetical protein
MGKIDLDTARASRMSFGNVNSEADLPFFKKLKAVVSNKAFVSLMGCLCGLFYVVTGIQYWLP